MSVTRGGEGPVRQTLEKAMACECVRMEDHFGEDEEGCCLPGEATPLAPVQLDRARRRWRLARRAAFTVAHA